MNNDTNFPPDWDYDPSGWSQRLPIVGVAIVGFLIALYLPISGALKNWVGSVNQNWRNHNHGDAEHIPRFMDIMTVTRPTLCVVDALICGEGDGPIANLPRWGGCIIASADPVATDATICKLLGHDWEKLNFAREAEIRGLGTCTDIEYVGVALKDVSFSAWPGHHGFDYLPLNVLVGEGVELARTVGHVKSALDSILTYSTNPTQYNPGVRLITRGAHSTIVHTSSLKVRRYLDQSILIRMNNKIQPVINATKS